MRPLLSPAVLVVALAACQVSGPRPGLPPEQVGGLPWGEAPADRLVWSARQAVERGDPVHGAVTLTITDVGGRTFHYAGFNDDNPGTDDGRADASLRFTALGQVGATEGRCSRRSPQTTSGLPKCTVSSPEDSMSSSASPAHRRGTS